MPDLCVYGDNTVTFPFRITLNGVPADVTLGPNDVWLIRDNGSPQDITSEITKMNAGTPHVSYYWQPSSASQVQASDHIILSVADYDSTGLFDANMIIFYPGGNVNARFSG